MRPHRRTILAVITGLALSGAGGKIVLARRGGRDRPDDDDGDYADAARARAAGEIRPLADILDHIKVAHPGEVVGIELERKKGRWVYEIKLIAPGGRFIEVYVDARDMSVIKIEGK